MALKNRIISQGLGHSKHFWPGAYTRDEGLGLGIGLASNKLYILNESAPQKYDRTTALRLREVHLSSFPPLLEMEYAELGRARAFRKRKCPAWREIASDRRLMCWITVMSSRRSPREYITKTEKRCSEFESTKLFRAGASRTVLLQIVKRGIGSCFVCSLSRHCIPLLFERKRTLETKLEQNDFQVCRVHESMKTSK